VAVSLLGLSTNGALGVLLIAIIFGGPASAADTNGGFGDIGCSKIDKCLGANTNGADSPGAVVRTSSTSSPSCKDCPCACSGGKIGRQETPCDIWKNSSGGLLTGVVWFVFIVSCIILVLHVWAGLQQMGCPLPSREGEGEEDEEFTSFKEVYKHAFNPFAHAVARPGLRQDIKMAILSGFSALVEDTPQVGIAIYVALMGPMCNGNVGNYVDVQSMWLSITASILPALFNLGKSLYKYRKSEKTKADNAKLIFSGLPSAGIIVAACILYTQSGEFSSAGAGGLSVVYLWFSFAGATALYALLIGVVSLLKTD
jgi:hypothetical protein